MKVYQGVSLIVVSVLVAILIASALNGYTRVTEVAPLEGRSIERPYVNAAPGATPGTLRDYMPIIAHSPTCRETFRLHLFPFRYPVNPILPDPSSLANISLKDCTVSISVTDLSGRKLATRARRSATPLL